jgi:hypothetical protein
MIEHFDCTLTHRAVTVISETLAAQAGGSTVEAQVRREHCTARDERCPEDCVFVRRWGKGRRDPRTGNPIP